MGSDDAIGKVRDPLVAVVRWAKSRSAKEKMYLMAAGAFLVGQTHWSGNTLCRKKGSTGAGACVSRTHPRTGPWACVSAVALNPLENYRGPRHAIHIG